MGPTADLLVVVVVTGEYIQRDRVESYIAVLYARQGKGVGMITKMGCNKQKKTWCLCIAHACGKSGSRLLYSAGAGWATFNSCPIRPRPTIILMRSEQGTTIQCHS